MIKSIIKYFKIYLILIIYYFEKIIEKVKIIIDIEIYYNKKVIYLIL